MEGLMSETELTDTLTKFMKGASAPGVDGFTVNWLQEFWPDLRKLVTNALNEMYGEELLSSMCREAIIRLLRKGDKNPLLPGNYRPISLLSIFYKLASATITRRIKPVLSRLVGVEQKAYLFVIRNKRKLSSFWSIFRKLLILCPISLSIVH